MNTFPADGIAKIELKDIAIDYYAPPQDHRVPLTLVKPVNQTIFPVASLLVTFQSKSGQTEEGGLFAPVIDMTGVAP